MSIFEQPAGRHGVGKLPMVTGDSSQAGRQRPFVGVYMKCCNVYVRAHLNQQHDAYVGWCPRCAAQVRIRVVQEGGSTDRFFEAS